MERLSWLNELRRLFDGLKDQFSVQKKKLLFSLTAVLPTLPLRAVQAFKLQTKSQGFSFDDVHTVVEAMPETFTWDELFDSMVLLRTSDKRLCDPATPTVREAHAPGPRLPETDSIKEDFPLVKFYNLNEISIGRQLKYLSIGGNLISSAAFEFPTSLIALNLSYNAITEFQPTKPLSNLKFLNLSYNSLENLPDITCIITILEFYVSSNKLSQGNFLFSIKNLAVLDLGSNQIENFEDIALLSAMHRLQTLNLVGNPLQQRPSYKQSIADLIPSLLYIDPSDTQAFSNFKQVGFSVDRRSRTDNLNNSVKSDANFSAFASFQEISPTNTGEMHSSFAKTSSEQSPVMRGRAGTPKTMKPSSGWHLRSRSIANNAAEKTASVSNSRTASVHKSQSRNANRLNNTTKPRLAKEFGNPAAVMMIGPPAVGNIFRQGSKKAKTVAISISKYSPEQNKERIR
jgi:hypothetical protein